MRLIHNREPDKTLLRCSSQFATKRGNLQPLRRHEGKQRVALGDIGGDLLLANRLIKCAMQPENAIDPRLAQPLPTVRIAGLPDSVRGVWSLWEISLSADDFSRRRFLSVFVNDEGRTFLPTAKRIWDLLLTEQVERVGAVAGGDADGWFDRSRNAALAQGEGIFTDLVEEHRTRILEERERAEYAYEARYQAIGRIGLQTVRDYRRKRLKFDHDARMAQLDAAEAYTPDLCAVLMLRVGEPAPGAS